MIRRIRSIPVLLINEQDLVKSVKFKNYKYIGDPINAVKIFNEKEVDEICILDITAHKSNMGPNFEQIGEIVSEAFMPLSYGGGIRSVEDAKRLFYIGIEKIIINKEFHHQPALVTEISKIFGIQSIAVSIDYKKNIFGKSSVYIENGKKSIGKTPLEIAILAEKYGAGEIILNNIDRDGTYTGYDLITLKEIVSNVKIPIVILGGASNIDDFKNAIKVGASAVAAGSMFVFQRPNQAVLISYINIENINQ
jgi:cyclase